MNYSVGDIIWVVLNKRPGLVVLQISEQITKKTLDGEETIYRLKPMNAREKNDTTITLEDIPGDIYKDASAARAAMIATATGAIDKMIANAQQALGPKSEPTAPPAPIQELTSEDSILLPDGTRARINIPNEIKEAIT